MDSTFHGFFILFETLVHLARINIIDYNYR